MGIPCHDPNRVSKLILYPFSCCKSCDLQTTGASAVAVSGIILVVLCFAYFDVLHVVPTALLLNTASVQTHSLHLRSHVQSPKFSPLLPALLLNSSLQSPAEAPVSLHLMPVQADLPVPDTNASSTLENALNLGDINASRTFENAVNSGDSQEVQKLDEQREIESGKCDLFVGRWVRDDSYPLYRSEACPFVDGGFRCQENGRPDDGYLKWRWQPLHCNMPRFNPRDMLERLRGRRMVFVGDSIGRNQWESMLCMLAEAIQDKNRIYEVNGEPITKHKGFLSFKFEDYNCTVEYYRSPFLVPYGRPPADSPPEVKLTLRVDRMDWSSEKWRTANILVFNAGHWWNYEKTLRGGTYFQVGNKVNMSMDVEAAFRRSIRTWADWMIGKLDLEKTQVLFRSYSPVHFREGTWKTGGQCDMETSPEEVEEEEEEPLSNRIVAGEMERLGGRVGFLNITSLTSLRKDGHSSVYHVAKGEKRPYHRQDCSHWCLPGVPDTWNELLYATILGREVNQHHTDQ